MLDTNVVTPVVPLINNWGFWAFVMSLIAGLFNWFSHIKITTNDLRHVEVDIKSIQTIQSEHTIKIDTISQNLSFLTGQLAVKAAPSIVPNLLKASRQKYNSFSKFVENEEIAMIYKDFTGIITNWTKGAEKLYGYSSEEMVGNNVTMLLMPEQSDEILGNMKSILWQIKNNKPIPEFDVLRRHKDGFLIDVHITVVPLKDENGKLVGIATINTDITNRPTMTLENFNSV